MSYHSQLASLCNLLAYCWCLLSCLAVVADHFGERRHRVGYVVRLHVDHAQGHRLLGTDSTWRLGAQIAELSSDVEPAQLLR